MEYTTYPLSRQVRPAARAAGRLPKSDVPCYNKRSVIFAIVMDETSTVADDSQ